MYGENRFRVLTRAKPRQAEELLAQARQSAKARWSLYQQLAALGLEKGE